MSDDAVSDALLKSNAERFRLEERCAQLESELARVRAERDELSTLHRRNDGLGGHSERCHGCGEPCSAIAGNPMKWPVSVRNSATEAKWLWFHRGCEYDLLVRAETAEAATARLLSEHAFAMSRIAGFRRALQSVHAIAPTSGARGVLDADDDAVARHEETAKKREALAGGGGQEEEKTP